MATEVTLKNVVAYVLLKSTHEDLTAIVEALRLRRSTLSQRAVAKFRRGDRVTFRNRTATRSLESSSESCRRTFESRATPAWSGESPAAC